MNKKVEELINSILVRKGEEKIELAKSSSLHLQNDLNFDSIEVAELVVKIERLTGKDVFDTKNRWFTGEIIEYVSSKE